MPPWDRRLLLAADLVPAAFNTPRLSVDAQPNPNVAQSMLGRFHMPMSGDCTPRLAMVFVTTIKQGKHKDKGRAC